MMLFGRSFRILIPVYSKSSRGVSDTAKTAATTAVIGPTNGIHGSESKHNHEQPPKAFEEIPGHHLHPLVSVLKFFAPVIGKFGVEKVHLYAKYLLKTYGTIVRDSFIGIPKAVCLFDPKDIETVFRNEGKNPYRIHIECLRQYRETRPDLYVTQGLLNGNGEQWYTMRQRFQKPLMHPENKEFNLPPVNDVADDFVERLATRLDSKLECPEFLQELYQWATESILYLMFGRRTGALKDDAESSTRAEAKMLIDAVQDTFETMSKLEISLQLFRYFKTPKFRKMARAQEIIAKTVIENIRSTTMRLAELPDDSAEHHFILARLLRQSDIKDSDIFSIVNDLLVAGVDTTSHAIAMLLYHLARNPQEQQTLYEELADVLPRWDSQMTNAYLNRLPYLKACLKESLRLSPIINGTVRILDTDIVLSGYNIPAGTAIMMHSAAVGMHGNQYENQYQFQPARFLRSRNKAVDDASTVSPFATLPFGFGARSCIGRRIAELEIHVLVAKLIRRFRVEYHYEDIEMLSRFINVPDRPLKFTFHLREK